MPDKPQIEIELVDRNKLIAEFMQYDITYPFKPKLSAKKKKMVHDHIVEVIMSMPCYRCKI